jgi:hypothetical protein
LIALLLHPLEFLAALAIAASAAIFGLWQLVFGIEGHRFGLGFSVSSVHDFTDVASDAEDFGALC